MPDLNDLLKTRWAESQVTWSQEQIQRIESARQRYELKPVSWRARILAIPVLGRMAYWGWLLLRLTRWVPELLEMRERLQYTLMRVSRYELAIRDQLLAGLSNDSQMGLHYHHRLPVSVYQAFEDCQRKGVGDVVTMRATYLPQIQTVSVTLQLPVLDIDCGCGEWIAHLESAGLYAYGVDISERMVRVAQGRGLNATCADILPYLIAQEPASVAAITAFQVVEHTPVPHLWTLLGAAYRVLAPGGLLLLSVTNSRNIQMAAYSFYCEASQIYPLPSDVLNILVGQCGFRDIRINFKIGNSDGNPEPLAYSQDYILMAYKPSVDSTSI